MSTSNTILLESNLKTLRLPTFIKEYAKASKQSGERGDSHESFLEHLAELEVNTREAKASIRKLKQASFPVDKDLSGFDFAAVPGLSKKKVLDLFTCRFIAEKASVAPNSIPVSSSSAILVKMENLNVLGAQTPSRKQHLIA